MTYTYCSYTYKDVYIGISRTGLSLPRLTTCICIHIHKYSYDMYVSLVYVQVWVYRHQPHGPVVAEIDHLHMHTHTHTHMTTSAPVAFSDSAATTPSTTSAMYVKSRMASPRP